MSDKKEDLSLFQKDILVHMNDWTNLGYAHLKKVFLENNKSFDAVVKAIFISRTDS